MSRVPSHTAFLFFFAEPYSENAQAPLFPHFLNRAQPPAEPAGQRVAHGVCVCVCMSFPACVCFLLHACGGFGGCGRELVHLGGEGEVCKFHAGSTEA